MPHSDRARQARSIGGFQPDIAGVSAKIAEQTNTQPIAEGTRRTTTNYNKRPEVVCFAYIAFDLDRRVRRYRPYKSPRASIDGNLTPTPLWNARPLPPSNQQGAEKASHFIDIHPYEWTTEGKPVENIFAQDRTL
jgi:hypothetical protein